MDAHGCAPAALQSRDILAGIFDRIVRDLKLRPGGDALWRVFPEGGGVTGLLLLMESHLACHTFPEPGLAGFNLCCCRPREAWPWEDRLGEVLEASRVLGRSCPREEA